MHYTEQISWILFLKFLDDFEKSSCDAAEIDGKEYRYILDDKYKWQKWVNKDNKHFS